MLQGILATAASVAGPLMGYVGQQETNRSNEGIANRATDVNIDQARQNREFQAAQSAQQMAFQERMANTAHQREVEDLRKAGLNPILSMHGGASSPSGASASGAQGSAETATMQNPMSGFQNLATTALEAMTMLGGLKKQEAETNLINAQSKKTLTDEKVSRGGIPKSEITNDAYEIFKPMINKLKNYFQQSAKDVPPSKIKPKPYKYLMP